MRSRAAAPFGPTPACARQPVGRIAAQCDEVGDLSGIDAVALAHLLRSNARHLTGADRVQDSRRSRRQLKGIAIATCHQRGAAAPLLGRDRGRKEVIGLVAGCLGVGEAAGGDESGQQIELIDELGVERASALIRRQSLVPIGRLIERVPADQNGARMLVPEEPQQEIGETDDRAAAAAVAAPDRLRQAVIRPVREGISVDDEQRPASTFGRRARFARRGSALCDR